MVAENFEHDAESGAHDNGMPGQRHVVLKGYYWYIPPAESKPIAESHIDKIITTLTTPLTTEEINPPQAPKVVFPPVKITAETYAAAVEKFQKLFNDNRWSDGLAIIPPTREAVDLMLTGTNRSPDEVIGTVKAKNGIATVEKIAINAVMAGASPSYLPVIIAAMEGLSDPSFDLLHPQASLGGFELAIWVSGPMAKELNMNYRDRLWTYGNRANSSIGRAIVLCRINLGQMWPAINDMARTRTVPFTNYIFAENNTSPNPWKPYHVIQGFDAEDSCVSVSTVWPRTETTYSGATAKDLLDKVIEDIRSSRSSVFLRYKPLVANPSAHPRKYVLMVSPEAAEELAGLGYTQEDLRNFVYEATRVPYEQLSPDEINGIQSRIDVSLSGKGIFSDRLPPDRIPVWQQGLKPGGKVPVLVTPEDLHFVVVGAQGKSISGWYYIRAPYTWSSHNTKKIKGATLTKAGRI
ncbi:MAG: hypothetical protein JW932_07515 [Deltaproteobacteria bacterium]|nr:hypothetical protein [Deltaproteobacteria bacterium]